MNAIAGFCATLGLVLYAAIRLGWLAPHSHAALKQLMGAPGKLEKVLLLAACVAIFGWSLWQHQGWSAALVALRSPLRPQVSNGPLTGKDNAMSSATDTAEIEALLEKLIKAHAEQDADAIVEAYAPDAVIYDLAPPLAQRGMDRDSLAAWLGGWEGPVQIDARDVNLTLNDNLAFVSRLNRLRGHQAGADYEMWFRATTCLRKEDGRWRIIHDHSSVPYYMDGSNRAAVDLKE